MKKVIIWLILTLGISLLTACGNNGMGTSSSNQTGDNPTISQQITSEPSEQNTGNNDFLSPEYDYATNELKLTNLSTGTTVSSYSFESAQTPLLMDKTSQGAIVMLSSQAATDMQNTGGITIISGNSSVETLYYWLFDDELNLVEQYELTDETLVNGLGGYVFAAAPDGQSLVYAEGSHLYQYTFATQKLTEITSTMSEAVYYEGIAYSDSGTYLAFFGSLIDQEKDTAYGVINLDDGKSAVFSASGFSGSILAINGEYAAISDTVLPNSMGGVKQAGSVLFLDLAQMQGKEIHVDSNEESGLAAVSEDGQYIVTCAGGDSPSGIVRGYHVSGGEKVVEQNYTVDKNCNPYAILVIGRSAYAVLGTGNGNVLSEMVDLP